MICNFDKVCHLAADTLQLREAFSQIMRCSIFEQQSMQVLGGPGPKKRCWPQPTMRAEARLSLGLIPLEGVALQPAFLLPPPQGLGPAPPFHAVPRPLVGFLPPPPLRPAPYLLHKIWYQPTYPKQTCGSRLNITGRTQMSDQVAGAHSGLE